MTTLLNFVIDLRLREPPTEAGVQILGMFNSGSNYLYELLRTNLELAQCGNEHLLCWKGTVDPKKEVRSEAPQICHF